MMNKKIFNILIMFNEMWLSAITIDMLKADALY